MVQQATERCSVHQLLLKELYGHFHNEMPHTEIDVRVFQTSHRNHI